MTSHDAIRACDPRSLSRFELEQYTVDAVFAYNDRISAERLLREIKLRNFLSSVEPKTAE